MRISTRSAALALAAAALVFLATIAACTSGDDEEESGPTEDAPAASQTAASQPTPGGDQGCNPGDGPPAEGEGPDELSGKIAYVRLVFGCQPDIYIMDANGDNATALTDDPALDDESDLSPDGTKITFFSGRGGTASIYVMNADGTDLQPITSGAGGDTSPRWSPDGSLIGFSRSGSIAVMKPDGSDVRVLMEAQAAGESEPCRAGSFVGGWAPDGQSIVYYSAIIRSGGQNSFWICTVNLDGGPPEVLVADPADKLHAEPHWSPDGRYIVFRDDRDGNCTLGSTTCNYDVFTLDLETGAITNVTNHPSLDIEPTWSPDSQWIVFASNRDDPNFDLYVVHPDGTGLQRILSDPDSKDSYPSWR
jgi:Tol biopolymer transport system component